MHRHLALVTARHAPQPRPAKVISLEARRKARFGTKRPTPRPPRAAAWWTTGRPPRTTAGGSSCGC